MAVIVLTGMPATGKSTICKCLTEAFGYPVIEKDGMKEQLFDNIGFQNYPEKRRLDYAANAVVVYMAEKLLEADTSFIVDNNFDDISGKVFSDLIKRFKIPCFTVFLKGEFEILYQRYADRDRAGERHMGHALQEHYPPHEGDDIHYTMTKDEFYEKFMTRGMDQFTCPGGKLIVDTSDFSKVDLCEIVSHIRRYMENH